MADTYDVDTLYLIFLGNTGTFENRVDLVQINYLKICDEFILSCKCAVNNSKYNSCI